MKPRIACVPVSVVPDFPNTVDYSKYVQAPCSFCGEPLWLGERGKALVDAGVAVTICPQCVVDIEGAENAKNMPIVALTDMDS